MIRLRKLANETINPGYGKTIAEYTIENNNGIGLITYDDYNYIFHVFVSETQNVSSEPAKSININDNFNGAFEKAEMYILKYLNPIGHITRNIINENNDFDINDSVQWDEFENNNQLIDNKNENEKEKPKKSVEKEYKTVEFDFYQKNLPEIQELVQQLIDKNLMYNYSVSPITVKSKVTSYKNVIGTLNTLYKIFNKNSRLRKIVKAYNYNNVLEYMTDHFIPEFYYNVDICSVYFTEENVDEESLSANSFIVKSDNNFIAFGATAEQDILNIQLRLTSKPVNQYKDGVDDEQYDGYPIKRFIQELKQSPIGSIALFTSFNEAEKYLLNMYNGIIKHKIPLNNNYKDTADWTNYEKINLNKNEQTNVKNVNDSNNKIININEPIMKVRIHYNPKDKNNSTEEFLKKWIKENDGLVFDAHDIAV